MCRATAPLGRLEIALTVPTFDDLPRCNRPREGQTAFVESPPSLWTCQDGAWSEIPCDSTSAGQVAYASENEFLVACIGGEWADIQIRDGMDGAS